MSGCFTNNTGCREGRATDQRQDICHTYRRERTSDTVAHKRQSQTYGSSIPMLGLAKLALKRSLPQWRTTPLPVEHNRNAKSEIKVPPILRGVIPYCIYSCPNVGTKRHQLLMFHRSTEAEAVQAAGTPVGHQHKTGVEQQRSLLCSIKACSLSGQGQTYML